MKSRSSFIYKGEQQQTVFDVHTYLLPALNVKIGPSSSAFLIKKSAMLLKPLRNGKDPTNGRDGRDGG